MKNIVKLYRYGTMILLAGLAVAGINFYGIRLNMSADASAFTRALGVLLSAVGVLVLVNALTLDAWRFATKQKTAPKQKSSTNK